MLKNNPLAIFGVDAWGDKFLPNGKTAFGEEIWVDGVLVEDEKLAQRIAVAMKVSFNAGLRVSAKISEISQKQMEEAVFRSEVLDFGPNPVIIKI